MAQCHRHIEKAALGACNYCGRPICAECSLTHKKGQFIYCKDGDDCLGYQDMQYSSVSSNTPDSLMRYSSPEAILNLNMLQLFSLPAVIRRKEPFLKQLGKALLNGLSFSAGFRETPYIPILTDKRILLLGVSREQTLKYNTPFQSVTRAFGGARGFLKNVDVSATNGLIEDVGIMRLKQFVPEFIEFCIEEIQDITIKIEYIIFFNIQLMTGEQFPFELISGRSDEVAYFNEQMGSALRIFKGRYLGQIKG